MSFLILEVNIIYLTLDSFWKELKAHDKIIKCILWKCDNKYIKLDISDFQFKGKGRGLVEYCYFMSIYTPALSFGRIYNISNKW